MCGGESERTNGGASEAREPTRNLVIAVSRRRRWVIRCGFVEHVQLRYQHSTSP